MSFGTQSMLPIGILQPTSSNFPVAPQPVNPANPPNPPNPNPGRGSQRSHRSNRSHSGSRGLSMDPFRAAPFLPPPPSAKSSRYQHHDVYGTLGGHQRPLSSSFACNELQQPQQQQQQQPQHQPQLKQQPPSAAPTLKPVPKPEVTSSAAFPESKDRYAIFDSLTVDFDQDTNPSQPKSKTSVESSTGGFENNFMSSTMTSSGKQSMTSQGYN